MESAQDFTDKNASEKNILKILFHLPGDNGWIDIFLHSKFGGRQDTILLESVNHFELEFH